jgi:hypothetical protein
MFKACEKSWPEYEKFPQFLSLRISKKKVFSEQSFVSFTKLAKPGGNSAIKR